jgi:microcystin-dependent protein
MSSKIIFGTGFVITIILIFVIIYLIRNRENLEVTDIQDNFVNVSSPGYTTLFDAAGNLRTVDLQTYMWTPINNGIKQAYAKLFNALVLPKGVIVAWTGAVAPAGWAICNGANGTPNLSGKFILGSGAGPGLTNRTIGNSGGAETVTLTEGQMPQHNHAYSDNAPAGYTYKLGENRFADQQAIANFQIIPSTSADKGGNQPHENMPPFFVLAYIMKL